MLLPVHAIAAAPDAPRAGCTEAKRFPCQWEQHRGQTLLVCGSWHSLLSTEHRAPWRYRAGGKGWFLYHYFLGKALQGCDLCYLEGDYSNRKKLHRKQNACLEYGWPLSSWHRVHGSTGHPAGIITSLSQGPAASAERQSCSSTEAASAPQQSGEAASFPAALLASSKQTRKT